MSKTICHICDKVKAVSIRITEDLVNSLDHYLDKVDVLPLVESTNVVSLIDLSFMENYVDCSCVVFNEKPVTYVLSLTIYRKRLTLSAIIILLIGHLASNIF